MSVFLRVAVGAAAVGLVLAACGREPVFLVDNPPQDAVSQDRAMTLEGGGMCRTQADCDDMQACTEDLCVVGGVCEHTPNDRMCMAGQRCFVGRGCASGTACMTNSDCDDRIACTQDLCAAGNTCSNIRNDTRCDMNQICSTTLDCIDRGRCGIESDCDDRIFCNGTERCMSGMCTPGTAPDCSDADPCTGDICSETTRMCTHPPVTPCGGTVTPGTYRMAPAPAYSCAAGMFGPVSMITLSLAGGISITGFPVTLTGAAPAMGMFSARGLWSISSCACDITLNGSFTMARAFTGSWSVSCGGFCPSSLGCRPQFADVTGTM